MLVLFLFWFLLDCNALVCPPFCPGGTNRSSFFLASFQEEVFVGRVVAAAQTAGQVVRVTGVAGEVEHVVEVSGKN